MSSTMVCAVCGWTAPPLHATPFRCPLGGDDDGHVLRRHLAGRPEIVDDSDPFLRFRKLTHAWHTAMELGMRDGDFVDLVRALDLPFRTTPLRFAPSLDVWIKDESGNVAGSHKSRHLMGAMIWLRVAEEIDGDLRRRPLAVAGAGNAALAAATIARAARRQLEVFVCADADPRRVEALEELGAFVTPCRSNGNGDHPAHRRFRDAVAAGALPFSCDPAENALIVDGGATLGWELAASGIVFDRVVIQRRRGALASSVIAAFDDALMLGVIDKLPRFDVVQTSPAIRGTLAAEAETIVVSEAQLSEANRRAAAAGYDVSERGSAGYAGVLARPSPGAAAVIFTGCR